ncbi:MAG: Hsp33 family molecular chaperone HslO [Bacillaceae bacterium]
MKDYLVKALGFNGQVRAYGVCTTNLVSEAQRRHDTWATASAALGRSLTAGVMMGAMLKGDQKLTIRINGGGPIGHIVVDANANGEVRGYVSNPHVHFDLNENGKLDVARAVGREGFLSVVKDIGMRENFTGQVPLISGELGEDFAYYYTVSEQTPASVGVGVLVNPDHTILAAGGFVLQIMPGAEEETIVALEQSLSKIPPVSKMVKEGYTPEKMLEALLGEGNVQVLEKMDVSFSCHCSKERIKDALVTIGKDQLQTILDEDGEAETHCHFCNEKYVFSGEELQELIDQA